MVSPTRELVSEAPQEQLDLSLIPPRKKAITMVDNVSIYGDAGQPILLLPGGAASCTGFFPGVVEGLLSDPGCRLIVHDRPGTGTSVTAGSLAGASAHLHTLIEELGMGPVIVVGQSLGGAVGVLLARDYPDDVAGVVLLDATPINDLRVSARVERVFSFVAALSRFPGIDRFLSFVIRRAAEKDIQRWGFRPDCADAYLQISETDVRELAYSLRGLTSLAADLREGDLRKIPAAVVTADRKPDNRIRRAHQRLADAFGGSLISWPGAIHQVHLQYLDETLTTIRRVASQVEKRSDAR